MRNNDRIVEVPIAPRLGVRPVVVRLEAPGHLYVPSVLAQHGLAGYEPETTAWALGLAETHGGAFFDVGANVGVFSWLVGSLVPGVAIVAFEPTPGLADVIENTARSNGLEVEVHRSALGSISGVAHLYLSNTADTSNSLNQQFRSSTEAIEVEVTTLDRFVASHQVAPGLLKIDTESTEIDVLRGGADTIAAHRPWIICEVLPTIDVGAVEQLLSPLGYRFFQLTDRLPLYERADIHTPPGSPFRNWLFAPDEPTSTLLDAVDRWRSALDRAGPALAPGIAGARAISTVSLGFDGDGGFVFPSDRAWSAAPVSADSAVVTVNVDDGTPRYLVQGEGPLDRSPDRELADVSGVRSFWVSTFKRNLTGAVRVQAVLVFYSSEGQRLASVPLPLREGCTSADVDVPAGAHVVRLAYRCAGVGRTELGPSVLHHVV